MCGESRLYDVEWGKTRRLFQTVTYHYLNFQRFADDGGSNRDDVLTAEEKAAIQKSSLPHLRMISNVAKNPLVTGLVFTLENFKDGVGNISKDILPIYEFLASIYDVYQGKISGTISGTIIKKTDEKNKVLHLLEDVAILKFSIEIVDLILNLVDGISGVDTEEMFKEPGEIISETLSICSTISELKDENYDSVVGGTGDDLIDLSESTKIIIDYMQGDGQNVIYDHDTSDIIKIKSEYSTAVSGNDVIIQVGKGGIIVKDAKDLKININTIDLEEGEILPEEQGALITNPYDNAIILMQSFQGNSNVLRGTAGNYRIENTLDSIMITGLTATMQLSTAPRASPLTAAVR